MHMDGKGARYTKSHKPKKVVFIEKYMSRSDALKRERSIKKRSHIQKQELINKNSFSLN